jgi:hypothetical protein
LLFALVKALLSGAVIAIVSEVAKRSPALGALIVSLPLVSILSVLWLWNDTGDQERIASHMVATFWYVLPTLPMFLLVPAMIRFGSGFWLSLGVGCLVTTALYFVTVWVLGKFGFAL